MINYVIATWIGARLYPHPPAVETMQKHLRKLSKLEHSLDQITVVNPYDEKNRYLEIDNALNNEGIVIMHRENAGMSYGSWMDSFLAFPDFDYYIFTEDDYVFNVNNFDKILIEQYEHQKLINGAEGYLCGHISPWNCPPDMYATSSLCKIPRKRLQHAAVSWGITTRAAMEEIAKSDNYTWQLNQLGWGWLFNRLGFYLEEVKGCQVIWDNHGQPASHFGDNNTLAVINQPVKFLIGE